MASSTGNRGELHNFYAVLAGVALLTGCGMVADDAGNACPDQFSTICEAFDDAKVLTLIATLPGAAPGDVDAIASAQEKFVRRLPESVVVERSLRVTPLVVLRLNEAAFRTLVVMNPGVVWRIDEIRPATPDKNGPNEGIEPSGANNNGAKPDETPNRE